MSAPSVSGEVLYVGGGQATTLNELAQMLGWITNRGPEIHYLPARQGDVRHSMADCSRARLLLGYEPATSLMEGLGITCQFYSAKEGVRVRTQPDKRTMIGTGGAI
jgi:nucleoside-diphosphate-sugar epimerase